MTSMMTASPNQEGQQQQQQQQKSQSAQPPAKLHLTQPLPLSAGQEAQVRELYHKRVRNKCADEVRDFASCCTHKTFTAPFLCRAEQKAMNACMLRHATPAERDAARAEWFATMDRRREEREVKEVKRKEDERFWREWWDKDLSVKPGRTGREGDGKA